ASRRPARTPPRFVGERPSRPHSSSVSLGEQKGARARRPRIALNSALCRLSPESVHRPPYIPNMAITISFPGGVAVDATLNGHTIHTDQPSPLGADSAMSPFDMFLASIGACMGYYALRFCQQRNIATDGLGLTLE